MGSATNRKWKRFVKGTSAEAYICWFSLGLPTSFVPPMTSASALAVELLFFGPQASEACGLSLLELPERKIRSQTSAQI